VTKPCILIDFENLQPKALERLVPGSALIKVFLGQNQSKIMLDLVNALQPFGADAQYIQIQGSGPDAVDFHIAFYVGEIATRAPSTSFQIISKDKGFDPLIKHLTQRGIDIVRLTELPEPAAAPAPKTVAKKPQTPATTARARAKEVVARLKKSTRPTTIAKLRAMLLSWYEKEWGEKSVSAVLQSLQDSKIVTVTGTKAAYDLG
jgi:hypothetical protein